jgi:phage terminase small subunit
MGDNESLTTRQRRFVTALLAAPTIRQAAEAADVSETTAWRYLSDPTVRREVADRQSAMLAQASSGVVSDMAVARAVLRQVMADTNASAASRVSAARAILDAGLRLFEMVSLSDRVAALEEQYGE